MLVLVPIAVAGCTSTPGAVATDIPAEQAEVAYWLDQPPTAQVTHDDFDALFAAAERAARNRFFSIDRIDFRRGLLSTRPLLSRQAFEVWRGDVVDPAGIAQSSLATIRRTVQFEFIEDPSGGFVGIPRVVVERRAVPERRVTNASSYRAAVAGMAPGTVTSDAEGDRLPRQYWYAIGRDPALERALARDIEKLTMNDE